MRLRWGRPGEARTSPQERVPESQRGAVTVSKAPFGSPAADQRRNSSTCLRATASLLEVKGLRGGAPSPPFPPFLTGS